MNTPTRKPAWTDAENAAVVALYFHMLDRHIAGSQYNKRAALRIAAGNRTYHCMHTECEGFEGLLIDRSKGSVEAKLMNCTACHRDLDPTATTMDGFGYRALNNYQSTLRLAMHQEITRRLMNTSSYRAYMASAAS